MKRNTESRNKIEIPLRFKCMEIDTEEFAGTAVNITSSGFMMRSTRRLTVGSVFLLTIWVRVECSGSPFSEVRTTGRVVAETEARNGRFGYSVVVQTGK